MAKTLTISREALGPREKIKIRNRDLILPTMAGPQSGPVMVAATQLGKISTLGPVMSTKAARLLVEIRRATQNAADEMQEISDRFAQRRPKKDSEGNEIVQDGVVEMEKVPATDEEGQEIPGSFKLTDVEVYQKTVKAWMDAEVEVSVHLFTESEIINLPAAGEVKEGLFPFQREEEEKKEEEEEA